MPRLTRAQRRERLHARQPWQAPAPEPSEAWQTRAPESSEPWQPSEPWKPVASEPSEPSEPWQGPEPKLPEPSEPWQAPTPAPAPSAPWQSPAPEPPEPPEPPQSRQARREARQARLASRHAAWAAREYPPQKNDFDKPDTRVFAVPINVSKVVGYINSVSVDSLDGLYRVLVQKMEELGISEGSHSMHDLKPVSTTSGNMRSIIRGVENATAENSAELQQLLASVKSRFELAGYEPKEEEPEVED